MEQRVALASWRFTVDSGRGIAAGWRRGYNTDMGTSSEPSRPREETQPELPEAIREAIEYGIDVSMLRANLVLTPAERLRRHQIALNTAETLRKAKRR